MSLKATIVVTNYNYERFVVDTVESALNQTVSAQVIVVDDGSTDDSLERLAEFDSIEVIRKSNGGQASAFNAGWDRVEGDVVFFLDGDDTLAPTAVEEVLAIFAANPGAVRCQFRLGWIDSEGRSIAGSFPEQDRLLPEGDLVDRVLSNPDDIAWQPTSGNAFSADLFRQIFPVPEEPYRISADHYLSNLSALYGSVLTIEKELGGYRVHGSNADHRSEFDVVRTRQNLLRTQTTRGHLIEHGRSLGLSTPDSTDDFESLTHLVSRLVSLRLGNEFSGDGSGVGAFDAHPFDQDRRWSLTAQTFKVAVGRPDQSFARRVLALGWVAGLAAAPRRSLGWLASKGLTR